MAIPYRGAAIPGATVILPSRNDGSSGGLPIEVPIHDGNLWVWNGSAYARLALGQALMSASLPVALASNYSHAGPTGYAGSVEVTDADVRFDSGTTHPLRQGLTLVYPVNPNAENTPIVVYFGAGNQASSFPMWQGEKQFIPIDDVNKVYMRAAVGTPTIHCIGA